MSTEVVVVIENQDACPVAGSFAEIVCGGESADTSAHNHQIVRFTRVHGPRSVIPEGSIADSVHGLERPDVISAQAGLAGRIVTGYILRLQIGGGGSPHFGRNDGCSGRECDSIQKITARDFRAHPQFSVARHFRLR